MKATKKTQRIVLTAMFAALTCVATIIIKIPTPLKGYMNLGDCCVLLAGWMLPPGYAFFAAGLGSGLADLLSGYAVYTPATFIIKGIMALLAHYIFKVSNKKLPPIPSRIIGAAVAEVWMVAGYFIFEGFLYEFIPSAANIPANALQGVVGLVLGCILIKVFEKIKIRIGD